MLVNALGLALTETPAPRWSVLIYFALWLMLWFMGQYLLKRYRKGHDPFIFPIVMLLLGWGLLQVDRLAPGFALRHAAWVTLGGVIFIAAASWRGNLLLLARYPYTVMILGLALVATTFLLGTAPLGYGPRLWLKVPFVNIFFQPSELLKLLFVVFAAGFFSQRQREVSFDQDRQSRFDVAWLGPLVAMWLFSMSLLVLQQDLGAATLFFFGFMALVYLSTGDRLYVLGGVGMLLIAGVIATLSYDRVALRMEALINPWPDASDRAFQIVQALYAIAAGGVMGSGIGQGFPYYIPVVHSDFALAAIAEEWGMIGSTVVIVCFGVLVWRGFSIAMKVNHPFYRFLSAGITILLATQTVMIIGGVAKLLPLTGVTLPFVSYGGSSMVISSLMAGLLVWVSPYAQQDGRKAVLGQHAINHRLERLNITFMTMFALMLIGMFWWGSVQSAWLAAREDNPRTVEAELRIQRGTIYDRNEKVLAENIGTDARQERALREQSAASVLGYTSLRYGSSALEEGLDDLLRGESSQPAVLWPRLVMHRPQVGSDIRLTLDNRLQRQAADYLSGESGALVLLSVRDGAIRSMASEPTFDPNLLDENFDDLVADDSAPLLNRALQTSYQPGRVLHPFILATGLENSILSNTQELPVQDLAATDSGLIFNEWEAEDVLTTWQDFQFDQIIRTIPMVQVEPTEYRPQDVSLAIAGEEAQLVTPLQVARALAILANEGQTVSPQLVSGIRNQINWVAWEGDGIDEASVLFDVVGPDAAAATLALFPTDGRIAGYTVPVESGPNKTNGWFIGFAPPENPRFALVIVFEDVESLDGLEEIGRDMLRLALDS